ncbi:sulfotransferase [Psychroserpens sp. SPM9]|uniref:sulfotransferase family protein n=1 Tax=Psychroserpens sp. SPM9 TaxID=2975598 RepID=UPI0021A466B6|nr:sulfotransferase [Psychroserpens sp. SPM9]MDG5492237.1 sulfotransferase [Psychroserpens sp. SPM9]
MTDELKHIWTSKEPDSLPDFIIGGAMKSGTTSLHAILNSHPDIAIAHDELGFFDIDNILQHPDFNFYDKTTNQWLSQSMEEHPELLWNWYHTQFNGLQNKSRLVGEDSTTYLCSETAAKRIALQKKPIKLLFILRQPTKRAISNYLHLVKSGRAIYSLEDTLRFNPNSIIRRSLYKEQLEAYYKYIPFERIKVVLFEDLIQNKEACLKEVCDFLEVDFKKFEPSVFNTHSNITKIPKNINLQLFRNRLLRKSGNYRYSNFLPLQPGFQHKLPLRYRLIDKIHKKINPKKSAYTYKAAPATEALLNAFFKIEFQGFDDLVKKEVYSKWFKNI